MVKFAKYSMAWYREREEDDLKLRSKLLKHTKRKKGETAGQWLNRVNKLYQQQTKIRRQ